ncbi:MAG: MBL fold metallo-hydrolase [Bacteroidales bacterium]|nr:MBL fold metallo-hydrolase [Bacteroidales bacterium]
MGSILLKSFSSGSCGNCYFLGQEEDGRISAGVLIDAGVSLRRVKRELAAEGLGPDSFQAMLITHDHMDHIRSLGSFCKYLQKPVYATGTLHKALANNFFTQGYIASCRRILKDQDWTEIVPGKIKAKYFVVPHDATQTVGYCIKIEDYTVVIMTDAGEAEAAALEYAATADTVIIESNFDDYMLDHGPYPKVLRDRIRNGYGHLSNAKCAEAVREFSHPGLRNVFLCHLSENNNTPDEAHRCTREALDAIGRRDVRLVVLPRQLPSRLFHL